MLTSKINMDKKIVENNVVNSMVILKYLAYS